MQEAWDALVVRFSRITDTLGRPIDPEIFETVVALNALDIPTVMSCGGHIDDRRGLLLPWVDIESSDPHLVKLKEEEQRLIAGTKTIHEMIIRLHNESADSARINAARQQANELAEKMHAVQRELRILQSEPRKKLAKYLALFYEGRQVPFDRRLVLSGFGRTRLQNQGAVDLYLTAPANVQRQKLAEYREEMYDFTGFLKRVYFTQ
jgi:hypothetical protein